MKKTPKLRFKEFSGDWESIRLEDISTKIGDGIHATPKYVDISEIKFINGNNIKNHKIVINENTKSISENELEKYNIKLDDSSILMSINGTIGNIGYYNNEKVLLGKSVAYININSENNKLFLGTLLETDKVQRKFMGELTGTTIKNLSLKSIRECKLDLPLKEEQEKIASFFSLIDDKISLQGEKVEALKDYKTGMMQKIFSRELRFKDDDGRDYPEWEEKKLGDIALICTGKKDTQDKIDNGEYPFFVRSQVIERINSYSYDGEAILTAGDGVGVGKVFHYINGKFDYHQRVYKISDFSENTYGRYIYEYFRVNFIREVTKYTAKTSVDSVRMEMITKMIIPYPVLDEQIKIANVLNNIDLKIEKEQEKLDSLNEYKKGLLQQMFV